MPGTAATVLGATETAPDFAVPAGACDCHVHLFGPVGRFPYAKERTYTPPEALGRDLMALHQALHIDRVVLVQASVHGADNSCMRHWLRELGPRARGVAVIDAATSAATLDDLHHAGVRGLRVNLQTAGEHDPAKARAQLQYAAGRAAERQWHVQTYTYLEIIAALQDAMAALPVPLVIDHFGSAVAAQGVSQPGFAALLSLVRGGKAWVKISAAYRISDAPDYRDVDALARALIEANPDRIVWGSDWPHTNARGRVPPERRYAIEPFRPEDNGLALSRLHRWAPDPALRRKILVDNPAQLYGF